MGNEADAEAPPTKEAAAWWCRLLARGFGVVAAIVCAICGIFNFLSFFRPLCVGAGAVMLCISFALILFETPMFCSFFETTQRMSVWIEKRLYWHKGLAYVLISIIPVVMCPALFSFLGCICPFATGVLYGLMSLGKKADREEMLVKASADNFKRLDNEPE